MALIVVLAAGTFVGAARPALAQDGLARARSFYANAAYEEALQVLQELRAGSPTVDPQAAAYQVFCLFALGRSDDAKAAIGDIVRRDPLYHPAENQASPRVRAFFEDVRRPMLADALRESYAAARDAFDRKDMAAAATGFDRVMALLDEVGPSFAGAADMKTLASGFRDLARTAVQSRSAADSDTERAGDAKPASASAGTDGTSPGTEPPGPPAPTPTPMPAPVATPAPAPPPDPIYSAEDKDVARPVVQSRAMPTWIAPTQAGTSPVLRGVVDLLIDEHGKVTQARMATPIHPQYDPYLLKAARDWTFKPATRNGLPVKYRYLLEVRITK
jgi:tetratricopeptide (TPR) repeat protein